MSDNVTVIDPLYVHVLASTKTYLAVFVGMTFVFSLAGNSLVVLVHAKIAVKTVTHWMIFYIAICDVLSVLTGSLFICQMLEYSVHGFPDIVCRLQYLNSNSASVAAYLFCACTAVERYCMVVVSKDIFSIRVAKHMWIVIFLTAYGVGAINIWAIHSNMNGHCTFNYDLRYLVVIQYLSVFMIAFVCSIVMIVCYVRIGVYVLRTMQELVQSNKTDRFQKSYRDTIQMTKMLAIVAFVFLISVNVPYITQVYAMANTPTTEPEKSFVVGLNTIYCVNTFFNPFLYMGLSSTFRQRSIALVSVCFGLRV